jgi:hypothetical protein
MRAITPATARSYVQALTLPAPFRKAEKAAGVTETAFETAKNEAAVVGSDVVSFVSGVTPERRQDIVNATLLAQLVAKKQVPDASRIQPWYDAYFDVLTNVGWAIQKKDFAEYHTKSQNLEAHKAILDVATTLLGPASTALKVVTTTVNALHSMSEDSPWITLFSRESQVAKTAHFQVTLAQQDPNGQFMVSLMAFGLEAKETITKVLFFSSKASEATLRHYSGGVGIATDVLDGVRDAVKAKLIGFTQDFVKKLPEI